MDISQFLISLYDILVIYVSFLQKNVFFEKVEDFILKSNKIFTAVTQDRI